MNRLARSAVVLAALAASLPFGPAASADVVRENMVRVGGVNDSSGGHIVFEGDRMYMGNYGTGFRIFDISVPEQPLLVGEFQPGSPRADAVPDAAIYGNRHIMTFGGTSRVPSSIPPLTTVRTEYFDVTDPANPVLLHAFVGAPDGEAHNGDIFDSEQLYLASGSGGDNGLRIYDFSPTINNPPDPNNTTPTNDPVLLFPSAQCRADATILCDPTTLWQNSPYRQGRPVGAAFTHTHDITIYPDYPVQQPDGSLQARDVILLAEGGNYTNNAGNTGSVFVIDITDPANPVVLYRWLHETGPTHHPIRYHHEAQFVDGQPGVMLVTDEDLHNRCDRAGGITAVRLDPTLTSGAELSEFFIPPSTNNAAVCSAHVFTTINSIMFMGSYGAGTQVIDYTDPSKPSRVGQWIGEGTQAWGSYFHEGYVYQGDISRGLDVLRYLGPNVPKPAGVPQNCPGFRNSNRPQIVGTDQRDVLVGKKGKDIICGLGKHDKIRGLGGNDILLGGRGNDLLVGGGGRDRLRGNTGNDRLAGGGQTDRCASGSGRDRDKTCERGR